MDFRDSESPKSAVSPLIRSVGVEKDTLCVIVTHLHTYSQNVFYNSDKNEVTSVSLTRFSVVVRGKY